eukprot:GDKK01061154.1.p1 GENE.GDKK01061154.1~~GDKK01061154.1.p1  ORF type:complete len:159 (+),score=29.74 GDKK01061154.1:35-478(+)
MSYSVKSIADLGSNSTTLYTRGVKQNDNAFISSQYQDAKKINANRQQSNIFNVDTADARESLPVNTRAPFENLKRAPTDYSRSKMAVSDNIDSNEYVERRNVAQKFRNHANESNIFGSFPAATVTNNNGTRINRNQSSAMASILSHE